MIFRGLIHTSLVVYFIIYMKCYEFLRVWSDKTSSEIVILSFCTGPSTFFWKDEMSLSYCWNCVCRCFLWKKLLKQRSTVMNSPKPGKARVCMEFSKPRDSWQHPPGQISMSYAVILSELHVDVWKLGIPKFPRKWWIFASNQNGFYSPSIFKAHSSFEWQMTHFRQMELQKKSGVASFFARWWQRDMAFLSHSRPALS